MAFCMATVTSVGGKNYLTHFLKIIYNKRKKGFNRKNNVLQKFHFRKCSKSCSILLVQLFLSQTQPLFTISLGHGLDDKNVVLVLLTLSLTAICLRCMLATIPRKRGHLLQVNARKRTLSNKYVWIVILPSFHPHTSSGSKNNLNKRSLTDHFPKPIAFA